jgi:hypothetical protein
MDFGFDKGYSFISEKMESLLRPALPIPIMNLRTAIISMVDAKASMKDPNPMITEAIRKLFRLLSI